MTTAPLTVPGRSSLGSAVAYGAFLACSWTWCIGMFLPVLLVRDYGIWGWIVFAIPNVVGAAAMGLIPRNEQSLRNLLAQHRSATRLFSLVTIAFHLFFNGWIIRRLLPGYGPSLTIALAILMYLIISPPTRRDLLLSIIVLAISFLALSLATDLKDVNFPRSISLQSTPILFSLAASCFFGFLLCPYLDLTFHRARRSAGAFAPRAFVFGFFAFFAMILFFSLRYATFLAPLLTDPSALESAGTPGAAIILGLYMSLQSAFTIAVHWRELIGNLASANRGRTIALAVAVFLVPVILGIVSQEPLRFFGLAGGEVFYRCFMGFYALYFPAYVYLCIIPRRTSFLVYAVAVILATPLFFAAFILNHMLLLLPALAIVLLAKLLPLRASVPFPFRVYLCASVVTMPALWQAPNVSASSPVAATVQALTRSSARSPSPRCTNTTSKSSASRTASWA
ncbi:MAG: hypothetical protein NTU53_18000 [Planctomycetota bacterium]|nr:hypothetical protein [Planctomycetota bacterium]